MVSFVSLLLSSFSLCLSLMLKEGPRTLQQTRIYPYPMVWPLPRPWSQSPSELCGPIHKGFLSLARPFLDLVSHLAGLETQTQNAAFFERKRPKRKPWHRGKSLNRKKTIAMQFLNASVLPRKALNRSLSWGFPLGSLLPKTRVWKHRILQRKRRPNANASVLGRSVLGHTNVSQEC